MYVKLTSRYVNFKSAVYFPSLSHIIASCNPAEDPRFNDVQRDKNRNRQTKREKKSVEEQHSGKAYRKPYMQYKSVVSFSIPIKWKWLTCFHKHNIS